MDWEQIQREQQLEKEMMEKVKKDGDNPLNSLFFGIGQPLHVYWENGNFNQCRFEGYSPEFLSYVRWGLLIPHLLWTVLTMFTNQFQLMPFFYYWTLWGWVNAIFSQILTMLAANNAEYWHVMAYAWLQVSHSLNLAITFGFWVVLMPVLWP